MFVQLWRVYDILIVVHVSGQDMRLIRLQEFEQSLRVDRLSAHLLVRIREGFEVLGQSSRNMHRHEDGTSRRHMRQILLQPAKHFFGDIAHVEMIAADVKNIVEYDVMYFATIKRIVCRPEMTGIGGCRQFVGAASVVHVVITEHAVERYARAAQLVDVSVIKLRLVAHEIAAIDAEHITLPVRVDGLPAIGDDIDVRGEILFAEKLRIGMYDEQMTVIILRIPAEGKVMPLRLRAVDRPIEPRNARTVGGQIPRRRRYIDELGRRIGRGQDVTPFAIGRHTCLSVGNDNVRHSFSFTRHTAFDGRLRRDFRTVPSSAKHDAP